MKNDLRSCGRILLLGAWAAASAPCPAADSLDKYGNRIYISENFTEGQNAQSRASLDAYRKNSQRVSGSGVENIYAEKYRELLEKENAKQNALREAQDRQREEKRQKEVRDREEMQAALENRRRREREDAQIVVVDGQFMTGKEARLYREAEVVRAAEKKWAEDKAAFDKIFGPLIRTTAAALEARRNGTPFAVPADAEPIARALVMDSYEGKRVSALNEIRASDAERVAIGMDLYRQCDLSQASLTGAACTAITLAGRGRILVERFLAQCADRQHPANGTGNRGAYGYEEGWAMLACALATPDGKLDGEQRRLAAALLAEVINGRLVDDYPDVFDKAVAALLVAAAGQAPELAQIPRMQQNYIPTVRKSDWSYTFKTYPAPVAGAAPLVPTDLKAQVWLGLATRLVLSDRTAYPGLWFAQVRAVLNGKKDAGLSASGRQTLQQALDGWCNRAQVSPWLRQALQADFDLACSVPEGKIAEDDPRATELKALWSWDCLLRDYDVAETAGERVKRLADEDPFHSGVTGFLVSAGAPAMERYITAVTTTYRGKPNGFATWTAIQGLTNFRVEKGEKLPDLGISPAAWRQLVIAGEASRIPNARYKWDDPLRDEAHTMARIKRIREEILGESAGELTLPEYSREPADLVQSLLLLTEAGLTPEVRPVVKKLLEQNQEVSDPATVLLLVRILGVEFGEWAQLGTWLDNPRLRPKDRSNPLYLPYLVAIIAREHATGYWGKRAYDPVAKPANDTERTMHQAIADLAAELASWQEYESFVDPQRRPFHPLRMLGPLVAEPGVRSLLAPALVRVADQIYARMEERHAATGTAREYEVSQQPYPTLSLVAPMMSLVMHWSDADPRYRAKAAALVVDSIDRIDEEVALFHELNRLAPAEGDSLADPAALLSARFRFYYERADLIAAGAQAQVRVAQLPREALQYSSPWETIPYFAGKVETAPAPATAAAITAFEAAAVGSPARARQADALVALQLQADLHDPLERAAEQALSTAAGAATDDGVAALAYATLRQRERAEVSWAYPPATRLAGDAKGANTMRKYENHDFARSREATGFAALVIAYRKQAPGAKARLAALYDPLLSADTRFGLGVDGGEFALLGTRARLAAVGSASPAAWLQRVAALPAEVDDAAFAAALVAAVRAHATPELVTAELLRLLRADTAESVVRLALRTLVADPAAARYFGPAWPDENPIPFQTAWMIELLDWQAVLESPLPPNEAIEQAATKVKTLYESVPEGQDIPQEVMDQINDLTQVQVDAREAIRQGQARERVHRLTPRIALLLAFAANGTTSEIARTIVRDDHTGYVDLLAKLAAEEDPALQPLFLRYSSGAPGHKPFTTEHWVLLGNAQLWPLPEGISEAE